MLKYKDLYKKVKEHWLADNGAFDSEYMIHCIEKTKTKQSRHGNGSQLPKFESK
jgi:tetrahydromethanopterin S-methyltransferase subunit A